MDEEDIGPWIRRKDSQCSIDQIQTVVVMRSKKQRYEAQERHNVIRKPKDASQNAKLDYYRKNGSETPVRPILSPIRSLWIPKPKLHSKTPDRLQICHRHSRRDQPEVERHESEVRSSRSYTDLTAMLGMRNVVDRTVIFHKTKDIGQVVNWNPKPVAHLPPLVKSYRRRTPIRWERAGRWLEELRDSHPHPPVSRMDLQFFLQSRQMSPRP